RLPSIEPRRAEVGEDLVDVTRPEPLRCQELPGFAFGVGAAEGPRDDGEHEGLRPSREHRRGPCVVDRVPDDAGGGRVAESGDEGAQRTVVRPRRRLGLTGPPAEAPGDEWAVDAEER